MVGGLVAVDWELAPLLSILGDQMHNHHKTACMLDLNAHHDLDISVLILVYLVLKPAIMVVVHLLRSNIVCSLGCNNTVRDWFRVYGLPANALDVICCVICQWLCKAVLPFLLPFSCAQYCTTDLMKNNAYSLQCTHNFCNFICI
jgi:hypothetical protein